MKKEEQRLLTMLNEKKISGPDYEMLVNALGKKSFCTQIEESLLINPFQKIAGYNALLCGLVIMVAMSLVGVYAKIYIDGILGFMYSQGIRTAIQPGFLLLMYQNTITWLIMAGLFLVTAIIFRQKRIRVIDFLGTTAMARYPILVSLIFTIIQVWLQPDLANQDFSKGYELHLSVINTVGGLIFMGCLIWVIMTYFFALKESSGLEGKRLWIGFLVCMALGDVIAMIGTRFFLYV